MPYCQVGWVRVITTRKFKNSKDMTVKNNYEAMSYLLINCEQGSEISAIEELKSIAGVTEVRAISGSYDILIKIESPTLDTLKEIINWKVRKIRGVRSTTTLICTESFFKTPSHESCNTPRTNGDVNNLTVSMQESTTTKIYSGCNYGVKV